MTLSAFGAWLALTVIALCIAPRYLSAAQRDIGQRPHKDMYEPLDVYFEDLHLMVEGMEFVVKGVSYNPFPLGVQSMDLPKQDYGGGGFCSPKNTVFGEDKSACFGSDMFDGVELSPGPPGPWWKPVWERDFAILKELGVNTLRVYNLNPYTKHRLTTSPDVSGIVALENGAEHLPFLDYAHENGLKVILPVVTDQTVLALSSEQYLTNSVESLVEELGNHPALLALLVGNELDIMNDPSLMQRVNRMMDKTRWYTFEHWNRMIPVSTALVDNPSSYDYFIQHLDVDFFTINAFRGIGLDSLFKSTDRFMGWTAAAEKYDMPVLLGEFGEHQQTIMTSEEPDWFNQQWKVIVEHLDHGLVGGIFFEYCDEPFTKSDHHQKDMGIVAFEEAVDENGRLSTEPFVWVPDKIVKKPIIFQAVKDGLPNSSYSEYHMNANVYDLMDRDPILSKQYDQSERPTSPVPTDSDFHDSDTTPEPSTPGKSFPMNRAVTFSHTNSLTMLIVILILLLS